MDISSSRYLQPPIIKAEASPLELKESFNELCLMNQINASIMPKTPKPIINRIAMAIRHLVVSSILKPYLRFSLPFEAKM